MEAAERVAVVIGGASGLGAATVEALRADGYRVITADIAIESAPRPVDIAVDVTSESSVESLFTQVVDGQERLDVVVNCAGTSTLAAITELAAEEFRRVVDVCLTGAFLIVKQAAQQMVAGGSIVSLASLNARQPGAGMAAYCSAKAGLAMLTEVAALEFGPRGIRVNAISPGLVTIPLTLPALEIPGVEEDYLASTPLGRSGVPRRSRMPWCSPRETSGSPARCLISTVAPTFSATPISPHTSERSSDDRLRTGHNGVTNRAAIRDHHTVNTIPARQPR